MPPHQARLGTPKLCTAPHCHPILGREKEGTAVCRQIRSSVRVPENWIPTLSWKLTGWPWVIQSLSDSWVIQSLGLEDRLWITWMGQRECTGIPSCQQYCTPLLPWALQMPLWSSYLVKKGLTWHWLLFPIYSVFLMCIYSGLNCLVGDIAPDKVDSAKQEVWWTGPVCGVSQ